MSHGVLPTRCRYAAAAAAAGALRAAPALPATRILILSASDRSHGAIASPRKTDVTGGARLKSESRWLPCRSGPTGRPRRGLPMCRASATLTCVTAVAEAVAAYRRSWCGLATDGTSTMLPCRPSPLILNLSNRRPGAESAQAHWGAWELRYCRVRPDSLVPRPRLPG